MVEAGGLKPDLAMSANFKDITAGIQLLQSFKLRVEEELATIQEKVSSVKKLFREFAAAERNRCAGVPLLSWEACTSKECLM
jgi:hypothetical protein